jgi:hypothetical protein
MYGTIAENHIFVLKNKKFGEILTNSVVDIV